MRILVATDAWRPQVNGVVRTYERLSRSVREFGVELSFITPEHFTTIAAPTYPEIRLSVIGPSHAYEVIHRLRPDYIHIATEGPIGLATRTVCRKHGRPFTTSYHTRFPEYIAARFPVKESWGYAYQRYFHNGGAGMMVATPSLASDLTRRGFRNVLSWTRGVDTDLFRPRPDRLFGREVPVFIYVGRIAIEKNLDAFLSLPIPGKKVLVGDGPQLAELSAAYPDAIFTGAKTGEDLARHYASADIFVFPSLTDTFGIVLLEAMASGVPVAAYPVTGPMDVISAKSGALDTDLERAALAALGRDRADARAHALTFSWRECARLFVKNIVEANAAAGHRPTGAIELLSRLGGEQRAPSDPT